MLLNEIINTTFKERPASFDKVNYRARLNGNVDAGKFGQVRNKKSDPHMVSKNLIVTIEDLNDDPYYLYIKYIAENKIYEHNPWVPRVYNITVFKSNDQADYRFTDYKYKADIEKLHKWNEFSSQKQLWSFLESFVNPTRLEIVKRSLEDRGNEVDVFTIVSELKMVIEHGIPTIDPLLEEAVEVIRTVKKRDPRFKYDTHDGNIMIRTGPTGPHLVLIDPLWNFHQDSG